MTISASVREYPPRQPGSVDFVRLCFGEFAHRRDQRRDLMVEVFLVVEAFGVDLRVGSRGQWRHGPSEMLGESIGHRPEVENVDAHDGGPTVDSELFHGLEGTRREGHSGAGNVP